MILSMNTLRQTRNQKDAIFDLTYILLSYPFKCATTKMHGEGGEADTKEKKNRPWESFFSSAIKVCRAWGSGAAVHHRSFRNFPASPQKDFTEIVRLQSRVGRWSRISLLQIVPGFGLWLECDLKDQLNYDSIAEQAVPQSTVKQDSNTVH